MVCVYKEKLYKVYQDRNEYILYNTNTRKHVHIKEFKTCTYLIYLLLHKKIPYTIKSKYYLNCLCILTDNKDYRISIENLLKKEKRRKEKR